MHQGLLVETVISGYIAAVPSKARNTKDMALKVYMIREVDWSFIQTDRGLCRRNEPDNLNFPGISTVWLQHIDLLCPS